MSKSRQLIANSQYLTAKALIKDQYMTKKNLLGILGISCIFFIVSAFTGNNPKQASEPWKAPASADTIKSPIAFNAETLKKGEELYFLYCFSCHGETGSGEGPAGAQLVIKPANFHDEKVTKQTNGAIFWKITTGRGNMIAFKEVLKVDERWQLVAFIRKLSKEK